MPIRTVKREKDQPIPNSVAQQQSNGKAAVQFVDNRSQAVQMLKMQGIASNSIKVAQSKGIQKITNAIQRVEVTGYEKGQLSQGGAIFEHISFDDGSYWSTKLLPSSGRMVYLDIREGVCKGQGFSVKDADAYKASDVKNWLLKVTSDKVKDHWVAYRNRATSI